MNRTVAWSLLLGATLVAAGAGAQTVRRKPEMRWAESVILGVEEARLRNVPIVLHLHSDD